MEDASGIFDLVGDVSQGAPWEDLSQGFASSWQIPEISGGMDWMKDIDWSSAFPQSAGSDSWKWSLPTLSPNAKSWLGGAADLGKFGFGAWQAIDRSQ
jgi:hypothetical protein